MGLSELRLEVCSAVLGNLPAGAFGSELFPKAKKLKSDTHNAYLRTRILGVPGIRGLAYPLDCRA